MLNSEKNKYSNSRVVRKKISEQNKKPWSVLKNTITFSKLLSFTFPPFPLTYHYILIFFRPFMVDRH